MSAAIAAHPLAHIGWRGDPELPGAGRLVRVVARHRAGYRVHDGEHEFDAQPAGHFLKRSVDPAARPAVGDFVRIAQGKPPRIEEVLPRHSMLTRAAAGERYARQVIATNIDHVLVLTGLDGDFNPARIERYLLLVEGSGAQAVVVLTKADRCADTEARIQALRGRISENTPVHAINAKGPHAVEILRPYLTPGNTSVLVGSSGVGKSTLTNTLLGEARQDTHAVRAHDSRGRHTTTHRALIELPQGGCLIDTPGMRELKLTGEENLELFEDIDALAQRCRFANCAHQGEPGCAVQMAVDEGTLQADRLRHYHKLREEREIQAGALEERLRRESQARPSRALGRRFRERDPRR